MAKNTFLQDFKAFAMKGNVVDMAVGVIIGGAFGKIVSSIVADVIMPPIGWLIGGVDFSDLSYELPANPLAPADAEAVCIKYGAFLQSCIDFTIIAFCVFLLVKFIARLSRKSQKAEEAPAPAPAPEPSAEEKLLTEIRDLLKNK